MEITSRMSDHALLARTAAAGSMVLLKNVANALPLAPLADGTPIPVAVFGVGQISTCCCDASVQPWRTVCVLDGLCANPHITPDGLLSHRYRRWVLERPAGVELPEHELDFPRLTNENAAAIVVITRTADDPVRTLRAEEQSLIARVLANFERTVLVLNTPGFVELGAAADCPAIVFAGLGGQELGHALADVLTGACAPSGHLAFTWPESAQDFAAASAPGGLCGYRYYDTLGLPVRFPFGWGLGYGSAELTDVSVALDGYQIVVHASVQNTSGTHPAQALVQVYYSNPAAHTGGAAWALNCCKKTHLLAPGEQQTLQLQFPLTDCAVYHADCSAYVLEAGYYDFRVGMNSRATVVAGSVKLTRNAVVRACTPLAVPQAAPATPLTATPFTYPGEQEELDAAHRRAIRFSDRWLPRVARRRGDRFAGCRGDGEHHTLRQLKAGECSAFTLTAALDDHDLRRLVCDFGFCDTDVPGALGASAALPEYDIPATVIAAGGTSLSLTRDILDEDEHLVQQQCCTAFPAADLLACSFDEDLLRAVGAAVGREMVTYGVTFLLAPGCDLLSPHTAAHAAQLWSEDPVVTGLSAAAFAAGVRRYGVPVLRTVCAESGALDLRAWYDVQGKAFELAAGAYPAALLPDVRLNGVLPGEDADFIRALIVDWHYTGMFLADGERYTGEPTRLALERSALRILNVLKHVCR